MRSYLLRRFLILIPTLLVILILSFVVIRMAPGSPFTSEKAVSPDVMRVLEEKYGFHQPIWIQLFHYLSNVFRGDLGLSTKYPQRSVNEIIADGLPSSLLLGGVGLCWAIILGVGAGLISAIRRNTIWDYLARSISLIGIGVPSFVFGPLLILIFSLTLFWVPPAGWGRPEHLILPALTLGTVYAAYISRLTRAGMLEVLQSDFIRTARAKGLPESTIIFRHALKGGILPVISYVGPAAAGIMVGSIVVEKIFNTPGIGPYLIDAATNRDYFLVMGIVLVYSVFLLVMNFAVDMVYLLLDPRMRVPK